MFSVETGYRRTEPSLVPKKRDALQACKDIPSISLKPQEVYEQHTCTLAVDGAELLVRSDDGDRRQVLLHHEK